MAATTISVKDAMMFLAREVGEYRASYINAVNNSSTFVVRGLRVDPHDSLKQALVNIVGQGYSSVASYLHASHILTTLNAYPGAVAGNLLEVAWWDAEKRGLAFGAIQEAIRESYPLWFIEKIVPAASSTITLASGTTSYSLPSDVEELVAIGIQEAATDDIDWKPPRDQYSVEGEPGARVLRFHTSSLYDFLGRYDTDRAALWYLARESVPSDESGTTTLPLEWFRTAVEIYIRRRLPLASEEEFRRLMGLLGVAAQNAQAARSQITALKSRPPSLLRLGIPR